MTKQTLRDEAARKSIVERLDRNLLVEAGAGSGKTESMARRMVAMVAGGLCSVDQIAAVTFTRKAASELRSRFRLELERQIAAEPAGVRRERLVEALERMERMFVLCPAAAGTASRGGASARFP
jgi:ATP-dependent helicase/nuclease subunit A